MAISEDLLFVGVSASRSELASGATASVAVLSRETWEVLEHRHLPCREIYDLVLVPPSLLDGVRRGFHTNGARVAEQDQHALFREVGVEPVRLWATGDPLPPDACKVRISFDPPRILPTSALVEVECTVENLGGAVLVSAPPNPVFISYRWIDRRSGRPLKRPTSLRSPLPAAAPPHRGLRSVFKLLAPPREGEFLLRVTLLQEGVAWFDDLDEANASSRLVEVVQRAAA